MCNIGSSEEEPDAECLGILIIDEMPNSPELLEECVWGGELSNCITVEIVGEIEEHGFLILGPSSFTGEDSIKSEDTVMCVEHEEPGDDMCVCDVDLSEEIAEVEGLSGVECLSVECGLECECECFEIELIDVECSLECLIIGIGIEEEECLIDEMDLGDMLDCWECEFVA